MIACLASATVSRPIIAFAAWPRIHLEEIAPTFSLRSSVMKSVMAKGLHMRASAQCRQVSACWPLPQAIDHSSTTAMACSIIDWRGCVRRRTDTDVGADEADRDHAAQPFVNEIGRMLRRRVQQLGLGL